MTKGNLSKRKEQFDVDKREGKINYWEEKRLSSLDDKNIKVGSYFYYDDGTEVQIIVSYNKENKHYSIEVVQGGETIYSVSHVNEDEYDNAIYKVLRIYPEIEKLDIF